MTILTVLVVALLFWWILCIHMPGIKDGGGADGPTPGDN